MRKVGYARVSTVEQSLSLQINALKAVGCGRIFTDQGVSGSVATRPGLLKALSCLKKGDQLAVWRLDRLGRSLVNLVQLLDRLKKDGIEFVSLNENIDTSSSGGRLIFHMMAALAEFERALISERTRAGMAAAQAQGRQLGRPPSLSKQQCQEIMNCIVTEELSHDQAAKIYHVHPRTLHRLLKRDL